MSFKLLPWPRVPLELMLLAIAWLLLFPVAISPVMKGVYFIELAVHVSTSLLHSSAGDSVRFGVWGYCWSGLDASFLTFSHDGTGGCSPHRIGYRVDPSVANALHVDGLTDAISKTLTMALVLHVVDCLVLFVAIICVQLANRPLAIGSVAASRSCFALVTAAGLVTWFTLIVDYIFGRVVGNHTSADGILQVSLGCGVWLMLAVAIILSIVWLWAVGCMYWRKKSIWWCPSAIKSFDANRMVAIEPKL
ncbi:hypothetical protein LXA43DRAFT_107446 [Ganoderma leucocontextum]|nr:hypothetical protein LXA43DRAFT_107446 [Ganoderma leucocontextum]